MSRPKDIEEKLERTLSAWRTLAPEKSFGGMTLAQFEAAAAPSKAARTLIAELQDKLSQAMAQRDTADDETAAKIQFVVNGVLADPTEGADSALYSALGYTAGATARPG